MYRYGLYLLRLLISEYSLLYCFDVLCFILYVCIAMCGCLCGAVNDNKYWRLNSFVQSRLRCERVCKQILFTPHFETGQNCQTKQVQC